MGSGRSTNSSQSGGRERVFQACRVYRLYITLLKLQVENVRFLGNILSEICPNLCLESWKLHHPRQVLLKFVASFSLNPQYLIHTFLPNLKTSAFYDCINLFLVHLHFPFPYNLYEVYRFEG